MKIGLLLETNMPRQRFAKAHRHTPGVMNRLEAAYAEHLKASGRAFLFEGITLKLAEGSRYTPDFMVVEEDGTIAFHETKGFWAENARTKIKIAAEKFPFKFIGVQREAKCRGGEWKYELFN